MTKQIEIETDSELESSTVSEIDQELISIKEINDSEDIENETNIFIINESENTDKEEEPTSADKKVNKNALIGFAFPILVLIPMLMKNYMAYL